MTGPTSINLTAEQLRMIADILDGLNNAPSTQAPAELGKGVPMLPGRIEIEADSDLLGWAIDDIGGCYMFEARTFP